MGKFFNKWQQLLGKPARKKRAPQLPSVPVVPPAALADGRRRKSLGIVLSGGGARGAYEAGVIQYIRTMLPPSVRRRNFEVQCGSSVGAINTVFMASMAHDPEMQGRELRRVWEEVREENIYRRDQLALWAFLSKTSKAMLTNLLKGSGKTTHFQGFLDTSPFHPYLEEVVAWPQMRKNIEAGVLKAVSIVATNVFTGRLELFIEKHADVEYTGEYVTHFTTIKPEHVRASAAIPVIFPSVLIDGVAYVDGGLRLNTPMSPAIQLGADELLVIGLHHRAGPGEKIPFHGEIGVPPSLGQLMGRVMNSIFVDRVQYDMEQLERINRIIDWGEMVHGDGFLSGLNAMLKTKEIRGDIANRGLKRIRALRIRPSEDIGELFLRTYQRTRKKKFTLFEKFLMRCLDVDPTSIDFLSYISFHPDYLKGLLDLGFEDARRRHNDLKDFLDQ